MAKKRNTQGEEMIVEAASSASDSTQSFIEKNQMRVLGIVGLLVLLAAAYLAYKFVYQQPREKAAMTQMFKAEQRFAQDSFALALESPGAGYDGFLDIIDNYGGTKAGNLAKYYAGISYLNLNRFEDAVSYLQSYKESGGITSITKYGAIGDAQSELGQLDAAISSYRKATSAGANETLTPYYLHKLGLLARKQGDASTAKSAFERITKDFPSSQEVIDANKYISAIQ